MQIIKHILLWPGSMPILRKKIMRILKSIPIFLALLLSYVCSAQNIGIGTDSPSRNLEVFGVGPTYLRVTSYFGSNGIEFQRNASAGLDQDWRLHNTGDFVLETSYSEFSAGTIEILRVKPNGWMGLGVSTPDAGLHVGKGTDATIAGGGYLTLGQVDNYNLSMDNNKILARNNGAPSPLWIQYYGGNTIFGANGGNVSIGTGISGARLTVEDNTFQIKLSNSESVNNQWYIGVSNDDWGSGDHQMLFSPTISSSDAILRLRDIVESDGNLGPLTISSSNNTQRIVMDGNEIDCATGSLYINRNSGEHTILNHLGGNVGIGLSSPNAPLHILTGNNEIALKLQSENGNDWGIKPNGSGNSHLNFIWEGVFRAGISQANGDYLQASDRRLKEDIQPLESTLDKIDRLGTYTYSYLNGQATRRSIGVMAQELIEVYPDLVYDEGDHYSVAYGPLAVVAIKGIQELKAENADLRSELEELRALVKEISERMN